MVIGFNEYFKGMMLFLKVVTLEGGASLGQVAPKVYSFLPFFYLWAQLNQRPGATLSSPFGSVFLKAMR